MNMKNEFAKFLETYGFPVLVVRQSKRLRCTCWNEKTQEGDRNCPFCFGLGWNPIVEKHITKNEDMTIPATLTNTPITGSFGQIAIGNRAYYFAPNCAIEQKDLIVETEWNDRGKPVYNGGGIYEVVHSDETQKAESGIQVYKRVYSQDTPIQKNIRGIRIAQVNGITTYQLAMEDVK
jgi:hypothetical protein